MPVAGGKALTASSVAELRNQPSKLNQSTRGSKEELLHRIASVRASGAAVGAKQKREGSVLKEGEGQGPRPFRDQQVFSKGRCWGRVRPESAGPLPVFHGRQRELPFRRLD